MDLLASEWLSRCEALVSRVSQNSALLCVIGEIESLRVRLDFAGLANEEMTLHLNPISGVSNAEPTDQVDVVIAGDAAAWSDLLRGKVAYVEQVNVAHGAFAVQGSPVHLSWLMPIFSEIFSPAKPGQGVIAVQATHAVGQVVGRYVESSGSQVYLETAGVGPAVILLHTAGRDARQWHPVMARLADRFALYAPDLPGRGRSECVDAGSGYLESVEEIAAWVRGVADSLGLESYLIAGCSLGGNLSLLLGATDPRVHGVLALQGSDFTPTISDGSLRMMNHPRVSLPHANMNFSMSLVGGLADNEARQSIRQGVRTLNAPAQRADLTAYARCDTRQRMAEVACPVLLFRGEDDWVVSDGMIKSTASRLINASPLRVHTVPGIGHFPHVESPDLVASLLVDLHDIAR